MNRVFRLTAAWRGIVTAIAGLVLPATAPASPRAFGPVDRLVARDEIRQQIARYALLADGDGINVKDVQTLADTMMTPDIVTEIYYPGATAPLRTIGRDAVKPPATPANDPTVTRHYMVETYFDALTPTTARTITTAVHFRLTRNQAGRNCKPATFGACGGVPTKITMWTYHMNWVMTAAGWQISYNGLRMDN